MDRPITIENIRAEKEARATRLTFHETQIAEATQKLVSSARPRLIRDIAAFEDDPRLANGLSSNDFMLTQSENREVERRARILLLAEINAIVPGAAKDMRGYIEVDATKFK